MSDTLIGYACYSISSLDLTARRQRLAELFTTSRPTVYRVSARNRRTETASE